MQVCEFVDTRKTNDRFDYRVTEVVTKQTIYVGDCREVLKSLPHKSVHLIVTSPPYNMGKNYGNWNDRMDFSEYLDFTKEWLNECYRILVDGGRICVNLPVYKYRTNDNTNLMFEYHRIMKRIGFEEREVIFWIKLFALEFASSYKIWGNPTPHNPYMDYPCEVILVMNKNGRRLKGKYYDLTRGQFYKWRRNVWFITPEYDRTHLAPYPEELPRRLIKFFSFVGQTVLDPFLGSGTTIKVANELGRNSIGIEIDRSYVEMAKKRVDSDVEIVEFKDIEKIEADNWFDFDSRCEVCHEKTEYLDFCVKLRKFICMGCCDDNGCMGKGICWKYGR